MSSILIIDANPELRAFASAILIRAGHGVREASEIRAAAALLREAPADLLLTDLTFSGRHAAETLEAIRRDFPSLEVIALAGLSHAAGCLRLGAVLGGPRTPGQPFMNRETMAFVTEMVAGLAAHGAHVEYQSRRQANSSQPRG
jgi:CheY-like chemotaxis protein